MGSYDSDPIQHAGPYSPAEMRFLGAQEAYGFLVRMRQRDLTPEVPRAFVQVLAQADALVGMLVTLAADGMPTKPPSGERLGDDEAEVV